MTTTTGSLVKGIDYVGLPTQDLDAARAFYGDVLGLEKSKLWGQENPVGAEFEVGGVTIALVFSEKLGITFSPSSVPLALHVDDVEAARAELEAKGVEFSAPTMDSGVCHMAHFKDPDGNVLQLHNRYAPNSSGD
jgi:predicted enzyme related to lactoylglutathione lyase